ncbi:Transcription initiation factor TFIID subunit 6 [Fasciola hepatica]|uniref:Transcription initiation factor TFIID subunit 6 n=1 Tax=Fasciola hepatica TaxID=6192 RepID=A0A4E0R1I2_FASHE|nr:Transcription initiation factor TFIID subunit 6 [Fasciola hepatica]
MDSSERRKLSRLLRKPSHSSLNKSAAAKHKFAPRNLHKSIRSATSAAVGEDESKTHGFNADLTHLCAEMCGISGMQHSAAGFLRKHLMQICRLMVHSIIRVMEQSRRGVPQASDIDLASILIGLEPAFGTATSSFLPIRTGGRTASSGPGGKVFFIRPDKEIDLKALLLREPAGVVYDVSLTAHWLAVNGRQPISPQNPPPDFVARMSLLNGTAQKNESNSKSVHGEGPETSGGPTSSESAQETRQSSPLAMKRKLDTSNPDLVTSHPRSVSALSVARRPHEVSQEVMIYFRELTEACVGANENRRHEALDNATLDPGLQPILPHLVTFITEGVRVNVTNHNLAILIYLMRLVKALVDNPHMSLEPYLHLLVPTVITCVLNRQLCAKPITDNHWALRDFAAKQLVTLCNRHNTSTNELYNRVTRELSRALCNWIEGSHVSGSSLTNLPGSRLGSDSSSATDSGKSSAESSEPKDLKKGDSPTTTGTTTTRGPSLGTAIHSMNTLYGILVALAEFGAQCLRILVFPLLPALCQRLTELVEPPAPVVGSDSGDVSVHSLPVTGRLAPADERSFEFLKIMMTNRISSLLADWRTRQNLGVSLDDYRKAYGCMASCLHTANRNPSAATNSTANANHPSTTSTTGTHNSTTSNSNGATSGPTVFTSISNVTTVGSSQQQSILSTAHKPVTKSLLTHSNMPTIIGQISTKPEDHTRLTNSGSTFPLDRSGHSSLPGPR